MKNNHKIIQYWLIEQVRQQQNLRDWKKLPASFEQAQVKRLSKICIDHFKYLDARGTIKERIAISKASTLEELLTILERNVPTEFKTPA
jgi:hypothetical protein